MIGLFDVRVITDAYIFFHNDIYGFKQTIMVKMSRWNFLQNTKANKIIR